MCSRLTLRPSSVPFESSSIEQVYSDHLLCAGTEGSGKMMNPGFRSERFWRKRETNRMISQCSECCNRAFSKYWVPTMCQALCWVPREDGQQDRHRLYVVELHPKQGVSACQIIRQRSVKSDCDKWGREDSSASNLHLGHWGRRNKLVKE